MTSPQLCASEPLVSRSVPTPPMGVALVIRAANDPRVSLSDLARLIEREPSLTVNLLKFANSAAYTTGREVKTVSQAVVLLGSRVIRNITVAHAVTAMSRMSGDHGFNVVQFWEDSLRRACAALVLARIAGYEDPSEAFTVGLIQDLGVLVLALAGHGEGLQKMRAAPAHERVRFEAEASGRSHCEHFVTLARAWGLPRDLIDAVAHHHHDNPPLSDRRTLRLAQLARAADLVADLTQTRAAGDSLARARAVLEQTESREPLVLERIVDLVAEEMVVQSAGLEIRIESQPSFDQLQEGASQALVSISYSYEELTRHLEQLLREKEALTRKLAASNATLRRLAMTDPLTGIGNRRLFSEALAAVLAQLATSPQPASLLVLDLDHFKTVNDVHGHGVGDDVLTAVADRLVGNLRADDVVSRLGGEEFGILLPGCDGLDGARVAERLRRILAAEPVSCRDGVSVQVTSSIGGVSLIAGMGADEAVRRADEAMYRAKQQGRDRVAWSLALVAPPVAKSVIVDPLLAGTSEA